MSQSPRVHSQTLFLKNQQAAMTGRKQRTPCRALVQGTYLSHVPRKPVRSRRRRSRTRATPPTRQHCYLSPLHLIVAIEVASYRLLEPDGWVTWSTPTR